MKNLAAAFATVLLFLSLVLCVRSCINEGPPIGLALRQTSMLSVIAAPTSIEQALKTAEVITEDGNGVGSCFPVAERFGCVAFLSCAHVAKCEPTSVKLPNGDQAPVVCSIHSEEIDVGLIWVRANPHLPVSVLPIADADPSRGAEAVLGGYPLDCGLWLSQGLIGSPLHSGMRWTSIPIYYGCSGGPVLVHGRVVGIARGVMVDCDRQQVVSTLSQVVLVDSFRSWLKEILALDPMAK